MGWTFGAREGYPPRPVKCVQSLRTKEFRSGLGVYLCVAGVWVAAFLRGVFVKYTATKAVGGEADFSAAPLRKW
jgi:hypothetical protein